jgi:hypothetical protein
VEKIRSLADKDFPDAEKIILVMDNANQRFENTHSTSSRYEPFPADEAKRKKDGYTLYAQTRELAKHGGDRSECDKQLGIVSADSHDRADEERKGGVEPAAQ